MKLTRQYFKFHGVTKEENERLGDKAYQQYACANIFTGEDIHGEGGQFVSCWRPYAEGPLPETGAVANYIKLLEDNLLKISRESMMLKNELDNIKQEK